MPTGPLLAFASTTERRACAPRSLLAACSGDLPPVTVQVGLAAACLASLDAQGASGLLSAGLAGGLDPALARGTVLLPEQILTADGRSITVDPDWHARALSRLRRMVAVVATGPLVGESPLLATPAQKQALHIASGAVAVDMESAALAHWADQQGLPFLVMRVLLDPANTALPAWSQAALRPDGTTDLPALTRALLRRPAGLIELARLGLAVRSATGSWRRALRALGPALQPRAPAA